MAGITGGEVGATGVSNGEVGVMGVDNISQRAAAVGVDDGRIAEPGESGSQRSTTEQGFQRGQAAMVVGHRRASSSDGHRQVSKR
jgi:hypothetical protein